MVCCLKSDVHLFTHSIIQSVKKHRADIAKCLNLFAFMVFV